MSYLGFILILEVSQLRLYVDMNITEGREDDRLICMDTTLDMIISLLAI